jgi:CRP-like cAMP-binding protein
MAFPPSVDRRQALESHFLFRHLREAEITALLARSRVENKRANELIFRKDSPGHGLMAVLSGQVKISMLSSNGREVVLNIINPGEIFGEMALLDGKSRSADATAMTACELLIIDRRDFMPFLQQHPEVAIRLLGVLSERLRHSSDQVHDILFLDLRGRLAKALLRLAEAHGRALVKSRQIDIKLSQRELGNLIGQSRESVNKQLRQWQNAKLLRIERGRIVLLDLDGIQREADFGPSVE